MKNDAELQEIHALALAILGTCLLALLVMVPVFFLAARFA